MQRVARHARAGLEGPAVLAHEPVHDRERSIDVLEAFQLAEDQRAVRPRAGPRDVEVVAARLGLEPALAGRSRRPVRRHPVAEACDSSRSKRPPLDFVSYHWSCQTPSIRSPMQLSLRVDPARCVNRRPDPMEPAGSGWPRSSSGRGARYRDRPRARRRRSRNRASGRWRKAAHTCRGPRGSA